MLPKTFLNMLLYRLVVVFLMILRLRCFTKIAIGFPFMIITMYLLDIMFLRKVYPILINIPIFTCPQQGVWSLMKLSKHINIYKIHSKQEYIGQIQSVAILSIILHY